MKRRIIAIGVIAAFMLSSCAGSSSGDNREGEASPIQTQAEESQATTSAETETISEKLQSVRIEVAWESSEELDVSLKGTTDDGEELQITKDDTEVYSKDRALIAEVKSEAEQSEHHVTFVLYKLDTHLELQI